MTTPMSFDTKEMCGITTPTVWVVRGEKGGRGYYVALGPPPCRRVYAAESRRALMKLRRYDPNLRKNLHLVREIPTEQFLDEVPWVGDKRTLVTILFRGGSCRTVRRLSSTSSPTLARTVAQGLLSGQPG